MMHRTSLRAGGGLLVIAGLMAGCSGKSPKTADGREGGAGPAAAGGHRTATAAPGSPGEPGIDSSGWTRVRVTSVELEPDGGKHILVVKALPPAIGWKLEIRPIPVKNPAEREFEVVGLAPAGPARVGATPEVVRCVVDLDREVEQVVVHADDNATVITTP